MICDEAENDQGNNNINLVHHENINKQTTIINIIIRKAHNTGKNRLQVGTGTGILHRSKCTHYQKYQVR